MADTPDRIWISSDRALKWTDYAFDSGIEYARASANVVAPTVDDLISRKTAIDIADARLKDVPDTVDLEADRSLFAAGYLAAAGGIKASLERVAAASTVAPVEQSDDDVVTPTMVVEALRMMVELWDANHPDDPCSCLGASDDCKFPPPCELCCARRALDKFQPDAATIPQSEPDIYDLVAQYRDRMMVDPVCVHCELPIALEQSGWIHLGSGLVTCRRTAKHDGVFKAAPTAPLAATQDEAQGLTQQAIDLAHEIGRYLILGGISDATAHDLAYNVLTKPPPAPTTEEGAG